MLNLKTSNAAKVQYSLLYHAIVRIFINYYRKFIIISFIIYYF